MWKKERERHNPNLAPQSLGRLVGQSVAKHGAPGKNIDPAGVYPCPSV
jgi:hypothetical protein